MASPGESILDGEIGNDEFFVIASGGSLVDGKVYLPPMMDICRAPAQYGQQTGETQDVWGFMIDKLTRRDQQRGGSGGGGGGGGVPLNTTTKQIDLSSPGDARDLLERSLASQLGRRPTEKEYSKFYYALTAREKENPRVTKTQRSADGSSQTSVVQQGLNREQYGQEYAQMDDDFMDTNAVNNAGMELLSLLGGG